MASGGKSQEFEVADMLASLNQAANETAVINSEDGNGATPQERIFNALKKSKGKGATDVKTTVIQIAQSKSDKSDLRMVMPGPDGKPRSAAVYTGTSAFEGKFKERTSMVARVVLSHESILNMGNFSGISSSVARVCVNTPNGAVPLPTRSHEPFVASAHVLIFSFLGSVREKLGTSTDCSSRTEAHAVKLGLKNDDFITTKEVLVNVYYSSQPGNAGQPQFMSVCADAEGMANFCGIDFNEWKKFVCNDHTYHSVIRVASVDENGNAIQTKLAVLTKLGISHMLSSKLVAHEYQSAPAASGGTTKPFVAAVSESQEALFMSYLSYAEQAVMAYYHAPSETTKQLAELSAGYAALKSAAKDMVAQQEKLRVALLEMAKASPQSEELKACVTLYSNFLRNKPLVLPEEQKAALAKYQATMAELRKRQAALQREQAASRTPTATAAAAQPAAAARPSAVLPANSGLQNQNLYHQSPQIRSGPQASSAMKIED